MATRYGVKERLALIHKYNNGDANEAIPFLIAALPYKIEEETLLRLRYLARDLGLK